jgi:hypothetical protein
MKFRSYIPLPQNRKFVVMLEKFPHEGKPVVFTDQWTLNVIWRGYAFAIGVSWLTEQDKKLIARSAKKESLSS